MPEKIEVLVGTGGSVPSKWSRWEAETAYNPLRSVSHNGSGYVCKKACTGVDPEQDVLAGDGVEGSCWILTAKRGKSAYEIAVENGFEGTEADYYEKLRMVPLQASAASANAKVAEDAAKNASASANRANNFSTISEQFSARAVEAFTGAVDAKTQAVNAQSGAETARKLAESYTIHPPVPGDNGNWQVWDGEKYVDSGLHSSGVYVGGGEMPDGYNVQIDPSGEGLAGFPCAAEVVEELPTPEARLRGKVILLHTNGEDKAYICVLKGGTYHWIGFLGWSGGEAEGGTAVLGVAILGKMVLGCEKMLGKLDAPVITLVDLTEKLDAPVIRLESKEDPKLDAPIIKLEQDRLETPVIYIESNDPTERLVTPVIYIYTDKLAAPVIELKEA